MKALILFIIIGAALATNYHWRRRATRCRSSNQCSSTAPCCRDENGQAIVRMERSPVLGAGMSQSGTCTDTLGNSGDVCDSSCGCKAGYECYRPVAGILLPERCYNATWVQEQRDYWANCRPPTCFFRHNTEANKSK